MTANVTIEINKKTDVVRVPTTAVRFRPTEEIFAAFNQPVPPEMQPRGAARRRRAAAGWRRQPGGQRRSGARPARAAAGGRRPGSRRDAQARPRRDRDGRPQRGRRRPRRHAAARRQPAGRTPGRPRDGRRGRPAVRRRPRPGQGGRPGHGPGRIGGGQRGQGGGTGRAAAPRLRPERPRGASRAWWSATTQMPPTRRRSGPSPDEGARHRHRGAGQGQAGRKPGAPDRAAAAAVRRAGRSRDATTIDALFGPLPSAVTAGPRVALARRTRSSSSRSACASASPTASGIELLEGELQAGTELVTAVTLGTESVEPARRRAGRQPADAAAARRHAGPARRLRRRRRTRPVDVRLDPARRPTDLAVAAGSPTAHATRARAGLSVTALCLSSPFAT